MDQVQVNVKDLKEAAEAIRKHDRALQNVKDQIGRVETQLQEVTEVQKSFADGVRDVSRVQSKMVRSQEALEDALDDVAALADERLTPLLQKLTDQAEQFKLVTARIEEIGRRVEEEAGKATSEMQNAIDDFWNEVGGKIRKKIEGRVNDVMNKEKAKIQQLLQEEVDEADARIRSSVEKVVEGYWEEMSGSLAHIEETKEEMKKHANEVREGVEKLERMARDLTSEEGLGNAKNPDEDGGAISRFSSLFKS